MEKVLLSTEVFGHQEFYSCSQVRDLFALDGNHASKQLVRPVFYSRSSVSHTVEEGIGVPLLSLVLLNADSSDACDNGALAVVLINVICRELFAYKSSIEVLQVDLDRVSGVPRHLIV